MRATLINVSENRNVTLSLPEPLLRKFRIHAASANRSMSSLLTDAIAKMVDEEREYELAFNRFVARLQDPPGQGSGDTVSWTRDELYER